ncbi:isoprenylcysteine carboxylmethyltransferase family protein [PVC group bacterium]|nr:isoprenylcysteine carboxylmethyltransferase family protein [PVC group bacterium]
MLKRFVSGIVICLGMVLPTLGNIEILYTANIWLLVLLGVLASLLQPAYNPFTITVKPKDKGTGAQIIWSVYLVQFAALLEAAYLRYPRSVQWDILAAIGFAGAVLGLSFRSWSVLTLGNLFTMHIDIQEEHSVIQKGPYKIVRHPSYLGAFIMYISTTVFLHSWFALIIALLILPCAFLRRIHYEEILLKKELGKEYEEYSTKVKRFLPWIW